MVGPLDDAVNSPHPVDRPPRSRQPGGAGSSGRRAGPLLGVGHDAHTTVHLAEYLAGVGYRSRKCVTVLRDGQPHRVEYDEIVHCCEKFSMVDVNGQEQWASNSDPHGRKGRGYPFLWEHRGHAHPSVLFIQYRANLSNSGSSGRICPVQPCHRPEGAGVGCSGAVPGWAEYQIR